MASPPTRSSAPAPTSADDPSQAGPTRRSVLGVAAGVAAVAPFVGVARADAAGHPAAAPAPTASDSTARTRLGAGTDFSVRVSPDGRRLALDLLGVLWVTSASGGTARRLTSDLFDIAQPDWSPDGETIAFQSYRDGVFNIWTVRPDGSQLRQLTQGPYDHREPRWSPDGRYIAFSSDARGSYGIYTYDTQTGNIAAVVDGTEEEYEPTWSPDGTKVAFVVADTRIDVVDVRTAARSTYVTQATGTVIHQPQWLNGTDVAYHWFHAGLNEYYVGTAPLVTGEEVFPFRASPGPDGRWFYTSDGKIHVRRTGSDAVGTVGFTAAVSLVTPEYTKKRRDFDSTKANPVVGIGSPTISPDGRRVAFRALGDLHELVIGGRVRPLVQDQWWKADPDFSPDGKSLAYATDRSGTLNLWVRDLSSGADRQVTFFTDLAAQSCRWSPDGRELAYLDQNGALYTVDVASGDVQRVFEATFEPGRPTWSPDGTVIALAAVRPYSRRYREGLSKILLVNRRTGEATYVDPGPDRSLQTRGDDGPVWSPDGTKLLYAMESVLWVLPVGRDGRPTGAPRQVTDVVSDAPTWAGDSKTVLYLSNGTLRTVEVTARSSRRDRAVALPLTWRNAPGPDRLVIHAGRLWDGSSERVRRDVDILVSGHRITGIQPHREGRPGTLVDASDKLVMPGLIDIHHHRQMQGYSYGNRQGPLWLSLGITTTRSPGDPAYQMVEEREAVQAGKRVAPRFYGTGEAIDGRRIYYNFMRPTFGNRQLGLELSRAGALDYDLMKCYVRLPTMWHKRVIEWAHPRGLPVTSHYHYPAMAFGGDGTEHIGATNRFGYSRTVTNVGSGYSDVISMFNDSKMARTPTLFVSSALYRDDTSLADDPRVKRMYPLWRQAALAATVATAKTTDQTVTLANLQNQVEQVKAMVRGGGLVTAGTDSPIDHLAVSTHMNLRAMVKFGLTPYEALVTATRNSGAYLGEQLGQVKAGWYADLAIVDGDPLSDIADAANVTAVVSNGRHWTVEQLLAPWAGPTSTNPSATTVTGQSSTDGSAAGGSAARSATSAPAGRNRVLAPVPRHPSTQGFWWNAPDVLESAKHSCCAEH
ncbi:amidohydrolase family protein [Terracoccus luteus]|uniref:Tol biopolymer transport system component n=1 Tax=Terracoccus luteus TaxID=53356 RepID=A0A839PUW1_9MICO|nr:amidohydrolase family protein [Terracoccus luteus]MBB2987910.1 Tol biopolymer transport system component [Terracoccus luteus]MCP2173561.1 Tol biopolymer transport system component [Terracoccus luteus]